MHTFSSGMVDPNLMNKVCCCLNTDELIITQYGSFGLIYEIDINSLETFCVEDVKTYAKKINLPLVNISMREQRELKGMTPLSTFVK